MGKKEIEIRIAVGPRGGPDPDITSTDRNNLRWLSEAMPFRDLNIVEDGEKKACYVKSWKIVTNDQMNREELRILAVVCDFNN